MGSRVRISLARLNFFVMVIIPSFNTEPPCKGIPKNDYIPYEITIIKEILDKEIERDIILFVCMHWF